MAKRRFLDRLLIVPGAHTRFWDTELQATLYQGFHRDWRCALGHRLCTPAILFGMLLLARQTDAQGIGLFVFAGAVLLLWLKLDLRAGLLASPVLGTMAWLAAHAATLAGSVWIGAAIVV